MELHGGTLELQPEGEEGGSCFTLTLPVVEGEEQTEAVAERSTTEGPSPLRGRRVLVVEDEPMVLDLLSRVLSGDGAWIWFYSSTPYVESDPERPFWLYRLSMATLVVERTGGLRFGDAPLFPGGGCRRQRQHQPDNDDYRPACYIAHGRHDTSIPASPHCRCSSSCVRIGGSGQSRLAQMARINSASATDSLPS